MINQPMDSSTMFLALLLKELGGEHIIHKLTFMEFPNEFEIMVGRTEEQDVKVQLVEDETLVKKIREERRREALKPKLIVP